MKAINIKSIIPILLILITVNVFQAYGQEEKANSAQDFGFSITPLQSDSTYADGQARFDLKVDIDSKKISSAKRLYVKITSESSGDVHFIRGIDREVLTGTKDVKEWEVEREAKEKQWEKAKLKKAKNKKDIKARYEKQTGKEVKKVTNGGGNSELVFGPFEQGGYIVHIMIKDDNGELHYQDQNILLQ